MEAKVNYILVGIFVLLLGLGLIGGVLWFGSGKQFGKKYETYLVYVDESVSGLNLNAPVKYRGVDVGSVEAIVLDPDNPERVRLTLGLERGTPVKEDTVAVLRTQGLTGIAYVDLLGGSRDSPRLAARGEERYPVIGSAPSLMARIDYVLPRLLANLERISESLGAVLDAENRQVIKEGLADAAVVARSLAENRQVIKAGLADAAAVARSLAEQAGVIEAGIRDAARAMEHAASASRELPRLLARMEEGATAVEKMAAGADLALGEGRDRLGRFADETLPELTVLVEEMRQITGSLRRTAREIEQNPAILLHGKPPAAPGPGE